jgi:glyoxylase-like metal-dependent hydrolase (beta-lactamase superfamily II)
MTHLHFDHCGGSVQVRKKQATEPAFQKTPNLSRKPLGMGNKPNQREGF